MKMRISLLIPLLLACAALPALAQGGKTRIGVIGLDHDHVWELLHYIANEPQAELVAIADAHPELIDKAKSQVPAGVRFYSDYVRMLDEARPEAVIITTENDRHLEILRECARRHIHVSTEKPMATNAADAREMERLANAAGIKLMVNYWNAWTPPTREMFRRVSAGDIGPIERLIVQYGHQGPNEIGVSKEFGGWLYDPAKNGGGAVMDFGCYGAELALWLKGRPTRVFATAKKLKTARHNDVDDDATIVLDYPDATVIVEPSWDWPYGMDRVYAFGPKGSLLATRNDLFSRTAAAQATGPDGVRVELPQPEHDITNPIAYFVSRIRENKPIEAPLSSSLNVQVMEILDAARESIRSGKAESLR